MPIHAPPYIPNRYLVAMVSFGRRNGLYLWKKGYGVTTRRSVLPTKKVSKHAAEAQDTIAGSEVLAVPSSHPFSSFVIDSDEQLSLAERIKDSEWSNGVGKSV